MVNCAKKRLTGRGNYAKLCNNETLRNIRETDSVRGNRNAICLWKAGAAHTAACRGDQRSADERSGRLSVHDGGVLFAAVRSGHPDGCGTSPEPPDHAGASAERSAAHRAEGDLPLDPEFCRRNAHLLHNQGDGALCRVGVRDGEGDTFATFIHTDNDEMTSTP